MKLEATPLLLSYWWILCQHRLLGATKGLTMDGGEEAGAEVVVEVLVLAHLKHLLPLLHRHLALDALCGLLLLAELLPAKLQAGIKIIY